MRRDICVLLLAACATGYNVHAQGSNDKEVTIARAVPPSTAAPVSGGAVKVLGRLNSSGLVVINGASQKASGVSWWPLAIGDEVEPREAPAYVRLDDRNRIVFSKDAVAKMNRVEDKHTFVYLKTGEVRFEPVLEKLFICAIGHLYVPIAGSEGLVRVAKDNSIQAVDSKRSLVDGGTRSCDESGPAAWWAGSAAAAAVGAGGSTGAAGAGAGTLGAIAGVKGAAIAGAGTGLGIATYKIVKDEQSPTVSDPNSISPTLPQP